MLKTTLTSSAVVLAMGSAAFASGGVGFLGAHDAAAGAYPMDLVLEIDRVGGIFEVEMAAAGAGLLREVSVNGQTGQIIEIDTGLLGAGQAAVASAYTAEALRWPEAIALASTAPSGTVLKELELEFDHTGRLVFEAVYYAAGGGEAGSIEFDAFSGVVVDSDFGGQGPPASIGLVEAIDAAAAAIDGVAIEGEIEMDGARRDYEITVADPVAQRVVEIEIDAATGLVDEIEVTSDPSWAEASAILSMLKMSAVDFAQAIAIAEGAVSGEAIEIELEVSSAGGLEYEVRVLTSVGVTEVHIDAVTGEIVGTNGDSGSGGPPSGGMIAIGVLDAVEAAETSQAGFTAFEAELEFRSGILTWEVELVDAAGMQVVELDLNAASGAVIEVDADPSAEEAAIAAANLSAAAVDRETAIATAIASVGGGFVYGFELESEAGVGLVWDVEIILEARRWEVVVDAIGGGVIAMHDEGPAHFAIVESSGGLPMASFAATLSPGDANDDDLVDGRDLQAVLASWGTTNGFGDLTFDGSVDATDLVEVLVHWGADYRD